MNTNHTLIVQEQNNIDGQDAQDNILYPACPVCSVNKTVLISGN